MVSLTPGSWSTYSDEEMRKKGDVSEKADAICAVADSALSRSNLMFAIFDSQYEVVCSDAQA